MGGNPPSLGSVQHNELRFERHTGLRNAINTSTRQINNNEAIVRPPLRLDGRAPLCLGSGRLPCAGSAL